MADGSNCNEEMGNEIFTVNAQSDRPTRESESVQSRDDFPVSRTFSIMEVPREIHHLLDETPVGYTELQSSVEESSPESLAHTWEMNYHEASIYLEEGENNDKFDLHPRSKDALPAYILVHNHWFYSLDLIAAVLLMGLAISEKPAVPGFALIEGIHASVELLCLSVMGIELAMKLRWMGGRPFFQHKRTVIKLLFLTIMIIEALVVLTRQSSHVRVTRALRPVFLIDNHYCKGIRRVIRQILQSLPPILDMLTLLLFFMLIFSVLGFYLFNSIEQDPYFSTLQGSFVSLFVLLTTANFPDVMMPSYAKSRWSSIFFIAFLVIHLYLLMNLMLAVVYETFTRIEKDKFRKLLLHRRKACQLAFRLLVTRNSPTQISFRHFEGLMKYYKPKNSRRDNYLMFKTLDTDRSGALTMEEFFQVYEGSPLKWKPKRPEDLWFTSLTGIPRKTFEGIHKLVLWKWTDFMINVIIAANGVWQVLEAAELSSGQNGKLDSYTVTHHIQVGESAASWVSVGFVSFYAVEVTLKIVGLGIVQYFHSNWNLYDFIVTLLAVAGLVAEQFHFPFAFIVILRPLRLLRLFKLKKRYRDVLGTLFIILPRFLSVALVLVVVYYFFAVIGMEAFSGYNMVNCCKNTTVAQFYKFSNDSRTDGYYYLNNFGNFVTSGITLFELMVVNNWFIIMDGYAYVATEWSRIFFMTFYVVTMVVINIVVAFVLEAFLFRIQYKRVMGDMDKDTLVRVDVNLNRQELDFCYGKANLPLSQLMAYANDLNSESVTYRGTRTRTKFSFSLKMYAEEVKVWLREAAENDQVQREMLLAKLQEQAISQQQLNENELHPRTATV